MDTESEIMAAQREFFEGLQAFHDRRVNVDPSKRYSVCHFPSYRGSPVYFGSYWRARLYASMIWWHGLAEVRIIDGVSGDHVVL
jgi:hypothetical protein